MKNPTLQPSANGVPKTEMVKAGKAQNRTIEGLEMKMIRIIEVQFYKQNRENVSILTEEIPASTPLSINVNFGAFSQ